MFKPLNKRVLIKEIEVKELVHTSGLILKVSLADFKEHGIGIVEIGGKLVKKGDKVVYPKFSADAVDIENEPFVLVSEDVILGIF